MYLVAEGKEAKSSKISTDGVVAVAVEFAKGEAMKDRTQYARFMECIERFAAGARLVIGGRAATQALLGAAAPDIDSFFFELFSDRAHEHSRKLAKALYEVDPDGLGHYTTLITRVPDGEYLITVDGRDLVRISGLAIGKRRESSTLGHLMPSTRPGIFDPKVKLQYMGPEVQLMGIYASLCDPSAASTWEGALADEAKLRQVMMGEIHAKIKQFATAGAADAPSDNASWQTRRDAFADAILRAFGAGPGRVLIGDLAISSVTKSSSGRHAMQFVTSNRLEDERLALAKLATNFRLTIHGATDNPNVPQDARLRKLTVYVDGHPQGRTDPIVYIFNSANHELVPYVEGAGALAGLRVGTPFVVLRFRLVEMWTVQLIQRMGHIPAAYARAILADLVSDVAAVGGALDHSLAALAAKPTESAMEAILPLYNFIGRLESAELARKRRAETEKRQKKAFHPPYYPAKPTPVRADERKT